ncbi:DNA cytosine methyltransferase (plasmid) [Stenotrophomonas maltophilia]|uniref:DNA cytosine methyltransferase n=1 Tax=Stenotrophomonas maltophilia TaxID=40324 RepID=UPI001D0CCD35|nr:DNA cytosine methyltransferase [Stenotrophomonas maltophilia]UXF74637.1 DNA cytosine methyltransferase [Stenotrophomonas maltophilia]
MLRKLPPQTALAAATQVAAASPPNGQAGFPAHVQVSYTKLGHSRGQPRLWLEGLRLGKCGFMPGSKFRVELDLVNRQVRLKVDAAGDRTVSKREKALEGGEIRQTPIVDVTGGALSDVLGEGARVRATLAAGEILFDLHPADLALEQREKRTREHVRDGYLTEATLCAGAGVSTLALKEGLEREGLRTRVDWIVDREGAYLELAAQNNDAIGSDTRLYEASLEEIDAQALSQVDVLQVSLPCTGHSLSGKAKRKLDNAEQHPTDALAVYGLLRILEVVNPSVVVSENVEQARDSASYDLVRAYLDAQGYVMSDVVLDAKVAGTIENRKRWWFCAISKGLAESYSMANLPAQPRLYETLGDALDAGAHSDESRWRAYEYLTEKAARDAAAGKGFKRQLVTPDSTEVGTIGRGYAKARSTEAFLVRDDGLQRLLSPVEHARVKGIPEKLVVGASTTLAHEALGQSILFGHAAAIGESLAAHLKSRVGGAPEADIDEADRGFRF